MHKYRTPGFQNDDYFKEVKYILAYSKTKMKGGDARLKQVK